MKIWGRNLTKWGRGKGEGMWDKKGKWETRQGASPKDHESLNGGGKRPGEESRIKDEACGEKNRDTSF